VSFSERAGEERAGSFGIKTASRTAKMKDRRGEISEDVRRAVLTVRRV